MEYPKVSIIVPIYNVEKYLERCMKSLLNQTLKDIEIILVDDGSPDGCPQMCDEYVNKDSRVRVIHKKNAGLGFARNSGIEIAKGDFVAFVDSDDYVELTMYEDLYREAIVSRADVVFAGFKIETKPDYWEDSSEVEKRTEWNGEEVKDFMLDMIACAPHVKTERKYQMSVWHSIYRASIIQNNNLSFPSERNVVSEDLPFQVDFLSYAQRIVYLPQSYYYYCLNGTSLTASFHKDKFNKFFALSELLREKTNNIINATERIDRFFIGYSRNHLIHLFRSNVKDKNKHLEDILNNDIWSLLSTRYMLQNLPYYSRLFYYLIINNYPNILRTYIKSIILIKQILNKRI